VLIRALVVSASSPLQRRLIPLLERGGALVEGSAELWEGLSRHGCDLLVIDRPALPEPAEQVVATIRKLPDRPEVILVQDDEDPVGRAKILSAGGLAVLNLGLADDMLGPALATMVARRREVLLPRATDVAEPPRHIDDFSAASPAMTELLNLARRVARADSSLLILGETGVGKEWLARSIHGEGFRSQGPFVAVNCAAVPEALLESELFGHEKGAFTGSVRTRRGTFELAHRGTLFLDEVADLPVHLQAKLLRVLEERRIQRLGSETSIPLDVRIMAATNRDLDRALEEGVFREDLYFRLSVVTLRIPPLRQRREDIAPLAHSYLERFSQQLGRPGLVMRQEVVDALEAYAWPGNVRELINVMERAVLLCRGPDVVLEDLPPAVNRARPAATGEATDTPGMDVARRLGEDWLAQPLKVVRERMVEELERSYLSAHLERSGGRIAPTAAAAGIDPRSLYSKMRRYGLRKERFRR
jgi:two-component system, NtrC family, response regulator AtoC